MTVAAAVKERVAAHGDAILTLAAVALTILIAIPVGARGDRSIWEVPAAVVACVPLLLRMRWPVPVAVIVTALDAVRIVQAAQLHPAVGVIPIPTMLAVYGVALRYPPRVAWGTASAAALLQVLTGVFAAGAASVDALYLNWTLVATAAGRLIAERRQRIAVAEARATEAESTRAAEARRQVTAERLRIARELHDVLAHHIAAVNAQAGVAQYLLRTDPDTAEVALAGITDNTRAALDELRVTLGLLRTGQEEDPPAEGAALQPVPGVERLPSLLDQHRRSGVDVVLVESGPRRPLPSAADLALYRIVQEALTNAVKHAPESQVRVDLTWTDTRVAATITNGPPTSAPAPAAGTGHGMLGMRERAAAADGNVTAGPLETGGHRVHVELPAPAAVKNVASTTNRDHGERPAR